MMNVLRKPWYASMVIFTIWQIVLLGGAFLQFEGHHISLSQMVKNHIVFGILVATVFLPGVITYLKWWHQVGWKGPANLLDLRLLLLPGLLLFFMLVHRFQSISETNFLIRLRKDQCITPNKPRKARKTQKIGKRAHFFPRPSAFSAVIQA